jgi:uncharacterized protein
MFEAIQARLAACPFVAYALVFGSAARGSTHGGSDLDIAIGVTDGPGPSLLDLGALTASLEIAAGRPVDLVLLNEAGPSLAYRVFRDGLEVFVRDRAALVARRARATLEYLDFKPIEDLLTQGVLRSSHGR